MRASRSAAAALAVATALACAACTAPTSASPVAKPTAQAVSAATSVKRALASCGLFPNTPGVDLKSDGLLELVTDDDAEPTGIDRVDVSCTLDALGLPSGEQALFQSTSSTGGFQTVTWARYTSTWKFTDTLTFEVRLYEAK